MPKCIVVANPKGGVGKSTIAYNLAIRGMSRGYRTALVDCDTMQSSAYEMFEERIGYFEEKPSLLSAVRLGPNEGWAEYVEHLSALQDNFDLIVVDTPAREQRLVFGAMYKSDLVIVPSDASMTDVRALANVKEGLLGFWKRFEQRRTIGEEVPPPPPVVLAWNKVELRTQVSKACMNYAREVFGMDEIRTAIPDRTGTKGAAIFGLAPFEVGPRDCNFGPNTPIGITWTSFCDEALERAMTIASQRQEGQNG